MFWAVLEHLKGNYSVLATRENLVLAAHLGEVLSEQSLAIE
jgi:hypothetical protein